MKNKRQEKIIEIITERAIGTQEDLAAALKAAGFDVTQATVSRDIKQLGLIKTAAADSKGRYVLNRAGSVALGDKYTRVLQDGVVSMDLAMNILVIKTVSGMAMAVAAALDAMSIGSIVGTIAGDDTIMCAIRTPKDAEDVLLKLKEIWGNGN